MTRQSAHSQKAHDTRLALVARRKGNVKLRAVAAVIFDARGPVEGAAVLLEGNDPAPYEGTTNGDGYVLWPSVPEDIANTAIHVEKKGYAPYAQSLILSSPNNPADPVARNHSIRVGGVPVAGDVNLPALLDDVAPLPPAPTRDALIDVRLSFQGLVVPTQQFGTLPWFEACLPWLTHDDRASAYAQKQAAGDTHVIVFVPSGPPLYPEPGQPYSADRFGPLDWTQRNTTIEPQYTALLREVIGAGFSKILLYLGGDGDGDHYKVAFTQLELLHANDDYRTTLYKYCVVLPGWDGVFYGWPLEQVMKFGLRFRELFPDGYLGLHYSTGHIPVGEGGADYLPRIAGQDPMQNPGRMADFDLLIGEFDDNLHQDSTWQILNRLERDYVRPPDQPAGDDPQRVYYLGTPNPRGRWGHCAMEFGEYEAVRCGANFAAMVAHVNANRAYLKSMGVKCTG